MRWIRTTSRAQVRDSVKAHAPELFVAKGISLVRCSG
jgi:hypothetical protein